LQRVFVVIRRNFVKNTIFSSFPNWLRPKLLKSFYGELRLYS